MRTAGTIVAGLLTCYWWIHLAATAARAARRRFLLEPGTHPLPPPGAAPRISALIPARDEVQVIEGCLRSLLAQDHPLLEVIVLDDGSTDGTGAVVDGLAARDPRLRRVAGAPLPPGWKGKNWALHQAAAAAGGDWLLLLDADVTLHPEAVRQAAGEAAAGRLDMVSWFASLELRTFWERSLMPFIADFIVLFSPLDRVNDPADDHCIANGQFILVRKRVYDAVGGHAAIRGSIIDDVSLARAVKGAGWRFRMLIAPRLMRTRMYATAADIWNGWAKNFYAAMQRRADLAAAAVAYLLLSGVAPAVLLPLAVASAAAGHWGWFEGLSAAAAAGVVAYRSFTHRLDPGFPWPHILLHPLQALALAGIIIDSAARGRGLRTTTWKGRSYGGDRSEERP